MYTLVGAALKEIVVKRQSLKNAVYQATKGHPAKAIQSTMAVVAKLKDRVKDLEKILKSKPLATKLGNASFFTAMAMVGDYMISTRGIRGGGQLKRDILAGLTDAGITEPGAWAEAAVTLASRADAPTHRFLRVDLHRMTRKNAIRRLLAEFKECGAEADPVLDNVIWVDPTFSGKLRGAKLVIDGTLTMMDRSACLSAQAVNVQPGDTVIDVCAAPGSKTLSFLSQLRGKGLVVAVEKNTDRFQTLCKRVENESICTISPDADLDAHVPLAVKNMAIEVRASQDGELVVVMLCVSFFLLSACGPSSAVCTCQQKLCLNNILDSFHPRKSERSADSQKVYMSVDPSCSGSGLPEQANDTLPPLAERKKRIEALSLFQKSILSHALSLPVIDGCLYSTCSIWIEENEYVVFQVLQAMGLWKLHRAFASWTNSELKSAVGKLEKYSEAAALAPMCYRSDLKTNGCRGFFLAVFYRA